MYHPGLPADFDQNRSWSEPWGGQFKHCECGGSGWPPGGQATCEGLENATCQDNDIAQWTVGRLEMAANGTLQHGINPEPSPFFIAAGFRESCIACQPNQSCTSMTSAQPCSYSPPPLCLGAIAHSLSHSVGM